MKLTWTLKQSYTEVVHSDLCRWPCSRLRTCEMFTAVWTRTWPATMRSSGTSVWTSCCLTSSSLTSSACTASSASIMGQCTPTGNELLTFSCWPLAFLQRKYHFFFDHALLHFKWSTVLYNLLLMIVQLKHAFWGGWANTAWFEILKKMIAVHKT